jgi:hypothetical protein
VFHRASAPGGQRWWRCRWQRGGSRVGQGGVRTGR